MRVEKTGMGDSTGKPCAEADMRTELDGYLAGLRALKAKPYVDPARTFIVGHSIGGIVGPLAAAEEPVRGLVALETVGTTWTEYELANHRRQLALRGEKPAVIADKVTLRAWCMHELLARGRPRAEVEAERPDCRAVTYPASDAYMRQIAAVNLPALWERLKPDVLVVYGSSDYYTDAAQHQAVVEVVNAARPGAATFVEIPEMDHLMLRAKDQAASLARAQQGTPGVYHAEVEEVVGRWLRERSR
jgi:hypothetical protein